MILYVIIVLNCNIAFLLEDERFNLQRSGVYGWWSKITDDVFTDPVIVRTAL